VFVSSIVEKRAFEHRETGIQIGFNRDMVILSDWPALSIVSRVSECVCLMSG